MYHAADLGAATYVGLYALSGGGGANRVVVPLPQWLVASVPFLVALLLRAAAWTYRLALPRWARKTSWSGLFNPDKKEITIEVAAAKHGDDKK